MKKKIIVRIAEGLGNQLFMYANAYTLSKKYNRELLIDNTSGYFKKKNKIRNYELNNFSISDNIVNKSLKFDTYPKDIIRKLKKNLIYFIRIKVF